MNVLGLHAYGHEAGACIIHEEGMCAISEERLSRKKYDGGFPRLSIDYVLQASGIALGDVDLVVLDDLAFENDGADDVRRLGYGREIVRICHHDAHAASAFFASPFEEAAVLVVDAMGSLVAGTPENPCREVQSMYRGKGNTVERLERSCTDRENNFGIGLLYEVASIHLGFGETGSGKLMALASYGKNSSPNGTFFRMEGGRVLGSVAPSRGDPIHGDNPFHYGRHIFRIPPRGRSDSILQRHADVARWVQEEIETALLYLAAHVHQRSGSANLCLAGGVALNCPANRRILDETPFKNLFVQPASSDSGIPLGCAYHGWHVLAGRSDRKRLSDAFLGRSYSLDEMTEAISQGGMEAREPQDLEDSVAGLLEEGRLVGVWDGRCEFGPRALGHRSILADPRSNELKLRLDREVKHRETFRPYAPSVLSEETGRWFDLEADSPFMLLLGCPANGSAERIPGVVHVDGSSRIQTLGVDQEPRRLRRIVEAFRDRTGVPMVLNTSFNTAGEPIVESPLDALQCFERNHLDALALDRFLIRRP